MIEELTPQVVGLALLLVVVVAPVLTLLASALLLTVYRRAVIRAMARVSGAGNDVAARAPAESADATARPQGDDADLYAWALRAPWQEAGRNAVAGLAFALVIVFAASLASALEPAPSKLALAFCVCLWPTVLATVLTTPGSLGHKGACVGAYFSLLLVVAFIAMQTPDLPPLTFGGMVLEERSTLTPWGLSMIWLAANGLPSALILIVLNRWVRAVGPLVLAFMVAATSGAVFAFLALLTKQGTEAVIAVAEALRVPVQVPILAGCAAAFALFGVAGWWLLRAVRAGYQRKSLSDQTLALDSMWLVFASFYAMVFGFVGLAWTAVGPVAFVAYKLASALARKTLSPGNASRAERGLIFLRVFSLGRRTESLFDAVARHWRHVGSLQLIAGPDVARSIVEPHQFLDFVSGRLARHFLRDRASLERRMHALDRAPDRDGRYRINSSFCLADTWESALLRLIQQGDVVLMDVRSFSERNAGCVRELRYLVDLVPLQRCTFIVDATTDMEFLRATLSSAWADAGPGSPNRSASPDEAPLHRFERGRSSIPGLLRRLCQATAAA